MRRYIGATKAIVKHLEAVENGLASLVMDFQDGLEAESAKVGDTRECYPEDAAPEHDAARSSVQEALNELRTYLTDNAGSKTVKGHR